MTRSLMFVLLVVVAGCARPREQHLSGTCEATDYALAPGTSPVLLAGAYTLVMVATSGDSAGRITEGKLTLRDAVRNDAALIGATDANVERVGALRLGPLDVTADSAPGVLAFESGGARPQILLRLGSGVNVQGVAQFEGGYTVLQVHRVTASGFSGAWRSGTSMEGDRATGHFCADRIGASAP